MLAEKRLTTWELYGLKGNPFSTNALEIQGGEISIKTFTGRVEEVNRIKNIFNLGSDARIFVVGNPGVGKTSFVNYVRYLAKESFFTHRKEIAMSPKWTDSDFLINTICTLRISIESEKIAIRNDLSKKMEYLSNIVELGGFNVSGGAFGFGGGFGKSKSLSQANLSIVFLQSLFEDIISEIIKNNYQKVILHYNNLDTFTQEQIKKTFNSIRDCLQNKNIIFIFVGSLETASYLETEERVRSIFFGDPIELNEFGLNDIKEILRKRVEELRIVESETLQNIVEDEAIETLFQLYGGNFRHIVNGLQEIITEVARDQRIKITKYVLCYTLSRLVKERVISKLAENDKKVLLEILKAEEITNKELSENLNMHPQNISKHIKKLLQLKAIYVKEVTGKEKYFSAKHFIKWLNLELSEIEELECKKRKLEETNALKQQLLSDYNVLDRREQIYPPNGPRA